MIITGTPLAPVGAEITDVDVETLLHGDSIAAELLNLLEQRGVLVFPGLGLDDVQQVALARRLGAPVMRGTPGHSGEHPEIFKVSLDPKLNSSAYMKATFLWHIDGMTLDIPMKASLLTGRVLPDGGSETQFASTYSVYDQLSDEEKEWFGGLKVWHSVEAAHRRMDADPAPDVLQQLRRDPVRLHPLVWTHHTGRKSLVIGTTAYEIEGLPADEGAALLDDLLDRATDPSQVYRHVWNVGDLVIWDNRGVLHRAVPYEEDSGREMHRVTLLGDEPIT